MFSVYGAVNEENKLLAVDKKDGDQKEHEKRIEGKVKTNNIIDLKVRESVETESKPQQ